MMQEQQDGSLFLSCNSSAEQSRRPNLSLMLYISFTGWYLIPTHQILMSHNCTWRFLRQIWWLWPYARAEILSTLKYHEGQSCLPACRSGGCQKDAHDIQGSHV